MTSNLEGRRALITWIDVRDGIRHCPALWLRLGHRCACTGAVTTQFFRPSTDCGTKSERENLWTRG